MNLGQGFPNGQYGAEDHFGGYGIQHYSSQAPSGSGILDSGAYYSGYGAGSGPTPGYQAFDGQDGDENGGEWNDDYNGGYSNFGDGPVPEDWNGDGDVDPYGDTQPASLYESLHGQDGVYNTMAQGGYQNGAQGGYDAHGGYQNPTQSGYQYPSQSGFQNPSQGGYQNLSQGGIAPVTHNIVHHVIHHVADDGYQQDPQNGDGWEDGYQAIQQDGQGWSNGYGQDSGDFDPTQAFGQPFDPNNPGQSDQDEYSGRDIQPDDQQSAPGQATASNSAPPQGTGEHEVAAPATISHATPTLGTADPTTPGQAAVPPSAQGQSGPGGFHIELKNTTTSSNVFAYITGQASDHGNALFILGSDGQTAYYPPNPPGPNTPLSEDCAIHLGNPGNTVAVTIPHIAGGRIWFSIDAPLLFSLNPGPALMEPSVTNESDPNFNTNWGFCELTFSPQQLYANISYVDFVSIPISLELTTQSGGTQTVSGMAPDGLDTVCNGLHAQNAADGKGWDQLVVTHNGSNLRALSPNQGMVGKPELFVDYYDEYIQKVWDRLSNAQISIDTQAAAGEVTAHVANGVLNVGGATLSRPTTHDIFTCSTGPFQTGSDATTNAIIPRIGAAFNRSTLLTESEFPEPPSEYYKEQITNHYARIVHMANTDGKGYAFPYDDVQKTDKPDQSGEVHASDPVVLTVTVGGGGASAQH